VFIRDLLQPWHLLIVLAIILLIFGPGKLSGLGSAVGSSIRDFKKATRDDDDVAGTKTTNGNVKSVADDEMQPVAALPAKSIVIDPQPTMNNRVVDMDDDDGMVASAGSTSGAPIKVGTTRKGYSRR
jgi:sec-independent protein translocase protein TatA